MRRHAARNCCHAERQRPPRARPPAAAATHPSALWWLQPGCCYVSPTRAVSCGEWVHCVRSVFACIVDAARCMHTVSCNYGGLCLADTNQRLKPQLQRDCQSGCTGSRAALTALNLEVSLLDAARSVVSTRLDVSETATPVRRPPARVISRAARGLCTATGAVQGPACCARGLEAAKAPVMCRRRARQC
eukprot:366026-Chlamydomonas_euryale.AAC.3